MQLVAANVDHLTRRQKPSRVPGRADLLQNQPSEHNKCDEHRRPDQQFRRRLYPPTKNGGLKSMLSQINKKNTLNRLRYPL
jgi:hypothetical protein